MKVELFPFQKKATIDLRVKVAEALGSYHRTHTPQVVSLQAPTGAGKTIILAQITMLNNRKQYLYGYRIHLRLMSNPNRK